MKNLKFYRIQNSNGTNPFLMSSDFTLSQLYKQIRQKKSQHKNFIIYYHYKPYTQQENGSQKLSQIIAHDPLPHPTFLVYDIIDDSACPLMEKYGYGIAESQKAQLQKNGGVEDQSKKQYSVGQNGMVVFDNRMTSLLASSVNHAVSAQEYNQKKAQVIQSFNISVMDQSKNKKQQKPDQGIVKRFLSRIGLIKSDAISKNLLNTINTIKKVKTKQDLKSHEDRQYSDYDPKFAAYLQSIYIKYAILSGYRLHYIQYKNMQDGIIKYKFPSNAKIAIIGDFGTGLSDSFGLLKHAIIQKQVDIIIHLGDVYYAGTPNQYKKHIVDPLNQLRKQSGNKFKKNVLFYSIPGNHDYYSWGLPFLTFVANINEVKQIGQNFFEDNHQNQYLNIPDVTKQQSSYFCLRSQDQKWQFIGLDTAFHDSNPFNQINGLSVGPRLRQKQVQWFVDKMQNFPGSTILLTHHQLFSIHDRISGSLTKYKNFSCINPILSAQLFKYLPSISCWLWGHQHSIMFFDDDVLGVRKSRLLGNSSFHVFEKQGPYLRKPGFPYIPLIQQDEKYIHKYLPVNPQLQQKNNSDCYFNLSYALIDFSKQNSSKFPPDSFSSTLNMQYYCCPCYAQQNASKHHFTSYLLYKQQIQPRISINFADNIKQNRQKQGKQIKNQETIIGQHEIVGNVQYISQGNQLYIKSEIGLYVDEGIRLTLAGTKFKIYIEKQVNENLLKKDTKILQEQSQKKKQMIQMIQINQNKQKIDKQQIPNKQQQKIIPNKNTNKNIKQHTLPKLILDGDVICFKQIHSKIKKVKSIEQKHQMKQQKEPTQQIISKQPVLIPISSMQLSNQPLPPPAQDLLNQTVLDFLSDILQQKRYKIKKQSILKDNSPYIKFGDAFTLKQIISGNYLTCDIGRYGGILKLKQLKKNQQPCLFMFMKHSKVKLSK